MFPFRGGETRGTPPLAAVFLVLLGLFLALGQGAGASELADDPAFLTEARCLGCHGHPARMALSGKTRLGWYINTHRMAEINEAHVSWRERHIIATHLYGLRPASPALQWVEYLAVPGGLALWLFLHWRRKRLLRSLTKGTAPPES